MSLKKKTETILSAGLQANRGARLGAVQALYQTELTGLAGKKVVLEFKNHRLTSDKNSEVKLFANSDLFVSLVENAIKEHIMIDAQISARLASGWTLERIDPIVRAALRLATYELLNRLDTPVAVIIDEYVGIVAAFHDGPEAGFVNGILDKICKETKADIARSSN